MHKYGLLGSYLYFKEKIILLMSGNFHQISGILLALHLFSSATARGAASDPLRVIEDALSRSQSSLQAAKVEDFLAELPDDWRSNYTFVYRSQSRQGASPAFPRALAFASDGTAIVTFNGEKEQHGYNTVELALVRPDSQGIELRDISFCAEPSAPGCRAALSEPNPPLCLACHGQSPHYIWAPYKSWPGVYGSVDDTLIKGKDGELKNFQEFSAKSLKIHPRYRQLLSHSDGSEPYRINPEVGMFMEHRANTHLTMVLLRQHARLLANKLLAATAEKPAQRVALIRLLMDCPDNLRRSNQELQTLARDIGTPLEDAWHLHPPGASTSIAVLYYSDGLMRLPGGVLSFLLPQLKEYSEFISLQAHSFQAIFDIDSGQNLRRQTISAGLDRIGLAIPTLGAFNAALNYFPADLAQKALIKAQICAVGEAVSQ